MFTKKLKTITGRKCYSWDDVDFQPYKKSKTIAICPVGTKRRTRPKVKPLSAETIQF